MNPLIDYGIEQTRLNCYTADALNAMNTLIDYGIEQSHLNCYNTDALNATGLMGIKKMAALLRMSAISEDTYSIMLP